MAQTAAARDLHAVPSTRSAGTVPAPGRKVAGTLDDIEERQGEDFLDNLEGRVRGRLRGALQRGALLSLQDARTRLREVLDALGG